MEAAIHLDSNLYQEPHNIHTFHRKDQRFYPFKAEKCESGNDKETSCLCDTENTVCFRYKDEPINVV
jgi:hypothetical protein